ncbi:MAG TPA: hypothetical protein VFQ91_26250 [Bryobacteraceae bacterium]|nr:hypothetical protein [Bryobacteraceae bacterium]
MKILWFAAAALGAAAQSIVVDPPVITSCRNGFGQASVRWSGAAAPVTVFAGDSPMTGQEPGAGVTQTGQWVTDGLVFTLRDNSGRVLASAKAAVKCDAGGWWPLEVGNEWHFRVNDRTQTGGHAIWRVVRKEDVNGLLWAVLDPGPGGRTRLRTGDDGRIYSLSIDNKEQLLIDPSGLDHGDWEPGARNPISLTLAGPFGEEISWRGKIMGLSQESGKLIRGVGPSYFQTSLVTGSSGGLTSGYTLLEAVIAGGRFTPAYRRLELATETQSVNFGAKSARNCAIPCYFTACFGADLPTTYKPCMEASVRGGAGKLTLVNSAGVVLFEKATTGDGWVRIPLYTEPAVLLPPGLYRVTAADGTATATLPLEIQ